MLRGPFLLVSGFGSLWIILTALKAPAEENPRTDPSNPVAVCEAGEASPLARPNPTWKAANQQLSGTYLHTYIATLLAFVLLLSLHCFFSISIPLTLPITLYSKSRVSPLANLVAFEAFIAPHPYISIHHGRSTRTEGL